MDDRLIAPESRAEMLDGRMYRTMGANQGHGTRHFEATGLFFGALADGYAGAVDMLTRADEDSDAAPDLSVFPAAPDPTTGGRQLEEIAVEVLDTERMSHATDKVEKFAARGVRRLFAIRVAARKVYEWDHAHRDWTELPDDAVIDDRCFRVPVPVKALVDRVLADDTVARALLARGNRVLVAALQDARVQSARASLQIVLSARGFVLSDAQRERVRVCASVETLEAWIRRAVTAETTDAVFD